ncbi:MAG: hypothetical protein JSS14_02355 [Proteobacteria bacterium]|nr:hypothetical protein [Pseudomonadota bacterium]
MTLKWTIEDMNAGLCDLEDLGKPKPQAEPQVLPSIEVGDRTLRERLRDDALRAYAELGGVEYLKKKPELLDKILAKSAMPDPAVTNINVAPPQWIIDLSERRLSYKHSQQIADDIQVKGLSAPASNDENDS